MPLFGWGKSAYPKLSSEIDSQGTSNRAWDDTFLSASSIAGGLSGGSKEVIRTTTGTEMTSEDEFSVLLESTALALEIVDRLAFAAAGQLPRDQLLEFLEPRLTAVSIDSFLDGRKADSQEQAAQFVSNLFQTSIADIKGISGYYIGATEIIDERSGYGETNTLAGIYGNRLRDEFGLGEDPVWRLSLFTVFGNAIGGSGIKAKVEESLSHS